MALIYIVSPKAIALMKQRGNWSLSQTDIANMVFHFKYDQLGRVTEKYIPSSGLFYIVYDPLNRPVLLQDANLRAGNRWNYIKYDGKGHAISQGIYTDDNPNRKMACVGLALRLDQDLGLGGRLEFQIQKMVFGN